MLLCYRGKGKRPLHSAFSFSASSLITKAKDKRVGRTCVRHEMKESPFSFVQCFYCSGKNKTHIPVRAMKYGLGHFSGSTCEFSVPKFACKTATAQYKDEW